MGQSASHRQNLSAAEQEILHAVSAARARLVETVQDWSSINTHSANMEGLAQFAGVLRKAFGTLPADVQTRAPSPIQSVGPDGTIQQVLHGDNLHVHVRPQAPVQILLTGHMDTVFPATSDFQKPSWLDADTLNGPGVADMKGGLLVMLTALQAFENAGVAQKLGYQIVLNSDEEISSLGSAELLKSSAAIAQLGFVYEPSAMPDGTLAGARKGIGTYSVIARGKSAHAGRNPQDGRNAIAAVADFFGQVMALNGRRDGLTVNVARLEGGSATNVVPDLAIGRFEVRVWTHADRHFAEARIADIIADSIARHDLEMTVQGAFNRPPKPMDSATEALFSAVRTCGADLGLTIGWQPSGGCCDGNNLAAAGLAVVDTLGVRGGAIHSAQEFLIADSLVERAQLSALLLMRLASGAIPVPPRIIP